MSNEQKPKAERAENLELNRETLQDLSEEQSEQAQGGLLGKAVAGIATEDPTCTCASIGNPKTC